MINFLRTDIPKPIVVGYMFVLMFVYVFVVTHTPIALLPGAGYDDGLYIRLGQYLAEGTWLGPYDHLTLIKGPGYPAFLAVGQWLGFPLPLARAAFHCLTVSVFVIVLHRFVRSFLLSGLLFTLLLWHPISFSFVLLRVVRENIYYGQVLLILASLVVVLFYPPRRSRKILASVVCGLLLGWFWFTREEGIWVIPAILFLVAVALWGASRTFELRSLLAPLTIIVCIFVFVQVSFRTVNLVAYGKFAGIELKEKNFERAMGAIDSVLSGGTKPFISITKAGRERIYAVSPSFASLREYFDVGEGLVWSNATCGLLPDACGEIGAGWFLWGLRSAAAQKGHFTSPTNASAFFKQIADEISAACTQGQLECSPQLIPEIPQTSLSQLAERLPSRVARAAQMLPLINPPLHIMASHGTEAYDAPALRFLNYPVFTKSPEWVTSPTKYRLSAWYYRVGRDWIAASVKNADGTLAQMQMSRIPSPDLQIAFKDPDASQQRFVLETTCVDQCVLVVETPEGQKVEKTLGQVRAGATDIALGGGAIHVDTTEVASDPFSPTKIEKFSNRLRVAILSHYFLLSIPTLIAGLLGFFIATVLYWRVAMLDVCYVMAAASWLLVFVRTSLLILIDVTSFPALDPLYLSPAYFLLMSGAVLSCAALFNLACPSVEFRKVVV
jgi:hypothetical protein